MKPVLINGTEYYPVKRVHYELARRDERCKRLENGLVECRKRLDDELVKCRKEIARLQHIVEYFETGCVCSRKYKHLEEDG